ncbi:tyrosine-type recombinase/integrase [Amycolatopsis ultiminotia]|uniref:tyrosine-type recombinase/integrase n=1 Tax=Amycolatopsis ultiminotia TaxID=543629 RepID=UPI003CD05755
MFRDQSGQLRHRRGQAGPHRAQRHVVVGGVARRGSRAAAGPGRCPNRPLWRWSGSAGGCWCTASLTRAATATAIASNSPPACSCRRRRHYTRQSLGNPWSPHDMRHTYASWLILKGVPLPEITRIMGRSDLEGTQRCARLADGWGRHGASAGPGVRAPARGTSLDHVLFRLIIWRGPWPGPRR